MSIEHPCADIPGIAVMPERPHRRALSSGLDPAALSGAGLAALRPRGASGPLPAPVDDAPVWAALLGPEPLMPAELAALAAITQARSVPQGHCVFSRTSTAATLVALRSGEVALGMRTADGTFRTERIVRGPAWLDQSSAWVDAVHAMDAQAQSPSWVLEVSRSALATQLNHLPGLAQRLIQGLAREVQALAANTHELMHKDAPARLAQWLCQRCEPVPGQPGQAVVRLHERKRDVASQLAITPETLSRLMRSFTRQGVIEVAGYTLRVLDTDALARLAQS